MTSVDYVTFDQIDPEDFLPLLNSPKIRKHLIPHDLFTPDSLKVWMTDKITVDAIAGCKVRGIVCDGKLAGWCGIQLEQERYEMAIIITDQYWGLGKGVFQEMMGWAKSFGHDSVFIHLLHTRPEYRFLKKIAIRVFDNELFGSRFITYQIPVK